MGSQRVGHNWATFTFTFRQIHINPLKVYICVLAFINTRSSNFLFLFFIRFLWAYRWSIPNPLICAKYTKYAVSQFRYIAIRWFHKWNTLSNGYLIAYGTFLWNPAFGNFNRKCYWKRKGFEFLFYAKYF